MNKPGEPPDKNSDVWFAGCAQIFCTATPFGNTLAWVREPWGKWRGLPGRYPLRWHLLDTAAAAHVLWESHLPVGLRVWICEQLRMSVQDTHRFVGFLAGLHDVGKACPCFQDQTLSHRDAAYIAHAEVTHLTLPDLLREPGREYRIPLRSAPYRIAELLGGHHGRFYEPSLRRLRNPSPRQIAQLGGAPWAEERRRLVTELQAVLGSPPLPVEISGPVAAVLAGLVILADWLASDSEWITTQFTAPADPSQRWDHTVRDMRSRLPLVGLAVPRLADRVDVELLLAKAPNALQSSLEQDFRPAGPGLLVITASTGYGKTEAAFVGVHRFGVATGRAGMVVCLPTQATTNAMWDRGTRFAGRAAASDRPVTLAHTMSAFYEKYREYCADDEVLRWLNGRHKPLLAGMSVVTIDQVLIAALATKFNMLRLWALAGKTLVIDEVHASEPYMQALLARLLSWCGHLRIPVILISATLPRHITHALTAAYLRGVNPDRRSTPEIDTPPYPGWLFTADDGRIQRPSASAVSRMREHSRREARLRHLRYSPGSRIEQVLRYVSSAIDGGGCLAVVCTTVPSAQRTFEQIQTFLHQRPATDPIVPSWLLHARFPYHQRRRIENDVIARFGKEPDEDRPRPSTAIVVTTSLLEQSLDVDFDLIVSDLAPIAHLIQRLGRVWRHDRPRPAWIPKAALIVLDPVMPGYPAEWTSIYPEYELAATRRVLGEHRLDLTVPDDVDALVQQVHDQGLPPVDDRAESSWHERQSTTALHKALAGHNAIPEPHDLGNLSELTKRRVEDADVTSRLGVDNTWLIPYYTGGDGRRWLDPQHRIPFPTDKPGHADIMAMVDASVRCPAAWTAGWDNRYAELWRRTPLSDAIPFPAPAWDRLRLDPELGLINEVARDTL